MSDRITPERALRHAKRYARRLRGPAVRTREIVTAPITYARSVPEVRTRNLRFLDRTAAGGNPAARPDPPAWDARPARPDRPAWETLCQNASRAAQGTSTGPLLRGGLVLWCSPRTGLRDVAIFAADEALATGDLDLAQWLADDLQELDDARAVQEFQARLAARQADWAEALLWMRRRYRARRGEPSPPAEEWVRRARQASAAVRLLPPSVFAGGDLLDDEGRRALGSPDPLVADRALEALFGRAIAGGGSLRDLRPAMSEFAAGRTKAYLALAAHDVAQSVRTMSVQSLRTCLTGRSVCLVVNQAGLRGSGLGPAIDAYDVVVRVGVGSGSAGDVEDSGSRTDVQVTTLDSAEGWQNPVHLRIVLARRQAQWREALKVHLRAGAQDWVGDASLRNPSRDLGLITDKDPFRKPSASFDLLRLVLHLDVCPVVDLIGPELTSAAEREWVAAHATSRAGRIVRMVGS